MCDNDVRAGLRHEFGFLDVEYVRGCKQIEFAGCGDQLDFLRVAHPRFLEVCAEQPVDQSDGWEVLDSRKAEFFEFFQEDVSDHEGVGAVYPCKHRSVFDGSEDFVGHFLNDLVCVSVGEQAG